MTYYVEIVNSWGDGLGKEGCKTLEEARKQAAAAAQLLEPGESVRITDADEY